MGPRVAAAGRGRRRRQEPGNQGTELGRQSVTTYWRGTPMRRFLVLPVVATAACLLFAQPVFACGGLVAPNGAVRLEQTTTLAAFHSGIEHYVTSFQYAGRLNDFGAIIPLPGVPTDVRRAGSWTLQRLERETQPPGLLEPLVAGVAVPAAGAQVLLQTRVGPVHITVIS